MIADLIRALGGSFDGENGVSIYADISGDISYFKEEQSFLTFIYYSMDIIKL